MSIGEFVQVQVRPIARKIYHALRPIGKETAEANFWRRFHRDLVAWYQGEKSLFAVPPPQPTEKKTGATLEDSAVLTWFEHQKSKYLNALSLPPDAFRGMKLLDVGAGPMPSAVAFEGCELYCLDPLFPRYLEAGFPIHYWPGVLYVQGRSEAIPLPDASMDAVISVNAIDHVDDLPKTASEIRRVLRPGGRFAMQVHYHKSTKTEPIEITDAQFESLFGWVEGLRKVQETPAKMGNKLYPGETFVVWSNVHGA